MRVCLGYFQGTRRGKAYVYQWRTVQDIPEVIYAAMLYAVMVEDSGVGGILKDWEENKEKHDAKQGRRKEVKEF